MSSNGAQLKSTLWEAANALRGSAVDRTNWKSYILPLLFFKRISDCWDEETAEAAELYGDVDPGYFDEIVRLVHFDGWQNTHAGEREVKMALRKTLFKYKLHQDAELFERAYGYICEYY